MSLKTLRMYNYFFGISLKLSEYELWNNRLKLINEILIFKRAKLLYI